MNSDQEEKLNTFMAVAGEGVEPDVAKAMLESAGWNLETALNGFLSGDVSAGGPAPGPAPSLESSSAGLAQENYADMSMDDLRGFLDAYEVNHSSCVDKADLVKLLEKSISGASPSNAASAPPAQPARRSPTPPAEKPPEPACPNCPLGHALERHVSLDKSCEISGPGCKRVGTAFRCASGCDFHACDVCCLSDFPEKWDHRLAVLQKKYPEAARSQIIKSLKKHDGAACIVDIDLQEIVEKKRMNVERQNEKDMQDEEYRECLLMDQHRQEQVKETEAIIKQTQEIDRQQQAEKAELVREAASALEAKRLRVSQPEPDKANPDRCQVVIRTPSGKRLTRTFLFSDGLCYLYDWIDVSCSEEEFVKESYQIVSRVPGSPNKTLSKSSRTLKEEGVEHQSVFMITSCS